MLIKYNYEAFLFQIVNIFNVFITFGDNFLSTPASYDQLYYELIRMHLVFDELFDLGMILLYIITFNIGLQSWVM